MSSEQQTFTAEQLNEALWEQDPLAPELQPDPEVELNVDEVREMRADLPAKPRLPILVLIVAILKDVLDLASMGLLGLITTLITWLIVTLWLFGKPAFVKRVLFRRIRKRILLSALAEAIPVLNFIPWWTILVVATHFAEKEEVKKIIEAMDSLITQASRVV